MAFEIDFLPVGDSNGDAICIRYGSTETGYKVHLVDGGFRDTGGTVIRHIEQYYGRGTHIANVVLSHADDDHATGLPEILEHFSVGAIWMNRPWLYAQEVVENFHGNFTVAGLAAKMREMRPYLLEIEAIASRRNIPIHEVFQGAIIGDFTVLAPTRSRYISLIPDLDKTPQSYAEAQGLGRAAGLLFRAINAAQEFWGVETLNDNPPATSASNETSVVQGAVLDGELVVLTADVGPAGLREAVDFARAMGLIGPPKFIQVPHHGSRRNVTPTVLDLWLGDKLPSESAGRGIAFCSVGKDAAIYPRKKVKNAFIRRGYPVHSTRGQAKAHQRGMSPRPGWVISVPDAFDGDVADE